ncbi:MAG TPA: hypothetical protein VGL42_00150 [Opitutaceae bacterium]
MECFDQAIALRETLLDHLRPWSAYNLAGVWLNRGDTLARMGAHSDVVLRAYERAAAILGKLEREAPPQFSARLALAWFNRGTVLSRRPAPASPTDAVQAFSESIRIAGACPDPAAVIRLLPAAGAAMAAALLRAGDWDQGWAAARRSVALAAGFENESSETAAIGLRCRVVLCELASRGLGSPARARELREEISIAVDAAESGLALAARWPDEPLLAPLALRLFQSAAESYAVLQPHFLGEFLGEQLTWAERSAAGSEFRRAARRSLQAGIAQAARNALAASMASNLEFNLNILRELRLAAARLDAGIGDRPDGERGNSAEAAGRNRSDGESPPETTAHSCI